MGVEKSFLPHPMLTFTGTGHVGAVLSAAGSRSWSRLGMKDAAAAVKGNDDPLTAAQVPGSDGVIVLRQACVGPAPVLSLWPKQHPVLGYSLETVPLLWLPGA